MRRSPLLTISRTRIAALVALVFLATAAYAQTFTTFDVPNSTYTRPIAINSTGQITGQYGIVIGDYTHDNGFRREKDGTISTLDAFPPEPGCDYWPCWTTNITPQDISPTGVSIGFYYFDIDIDFYVLSFLWQPGGAVTSFGQYPFEPFTYAQGINPNGQITGYVYPGMLFAVGFLREPDGTITEFYPAGAEYTFARAINPAGQITGDYDNYEEGPEHGFLREPDGTLTMFDVPGGQGTYATKINSAGQIIGYYPDASSVYHGFLRQKDGSIITFDVPNSPNTVPTAIDQNGSITGVAGTHGFVRRRNGTIFTFDVPNSTSTYPAAMNSRGQITGWYSDASGVHGFIRSTPPMTAISPTPK